MVLEHGREYFVNADDCFEIVEEGNGGEKRRVGVYLSGKKNVTIDGGGSALKVFGDLTPLLLKGCKNVRIKNLVVDFVCEGCKGRKDGCVCANASAPQTWREEARRCEKYACASVLSCEGVVFENVRLRNFDGTAIYVKNSKNVLLSKIECVLSAAGCACDGFFRFEDCEGKVIADSCTARGCVSHGDFLHVRGKKKCNLVATNNCAGDNAGRGIYYACRGKAKVVGNTFGKTGGVLRKRFRGVRARFARREKGDFRKQRDRRVRERLRRKMLGGVLPRDGGEKSRRGYGIQAKTRGKNQFEKQPLFQSRERRTSRVPFRIEKGDVEEQQFRSPL